MEQVVDLLDDRGLEELGVSLLSIAPDAPDAWAGEARAAATGAPLLSDPGNEVASAYGVMRWAMPSNEPGHTFVLVGADGRILWIRDYGAPENGGVMYVEPSEIDAQVRDALPPER